MNRQIWIMLLPMVAWDVVSCVFTTAYLIRGKGPSSVSIISFLIVVLFVAAQVARGIVPFLDFAVFVVGAIVIHGLLNFGLPALLAKTWKVFNH